MTSTSDAKYLAFIDLETTQSDPDHQWGAPLEVGVVLVRNEPELPEVARANLVIRPPGNTQDHELMWQAMVPEVRAMHDANGLWREATHSDEAWRVDEADASLGQWLGDRTGGQPVVFAGSGVAHLDRPWLLRWFPATFSWGKYYVADFGSVRRALQMAGRDDLVNLQRDVMAKPHRALGDAEMHVAEARVYLKLLGQLPARG